MQPQIENPAARRMFCSSCGYDLQNLPTARCPECGREFDADEPMSFLDTHRMAAYWPFRLMLMAAVYPIVPLISLYVTWVFVAWKMGELPRPRFDHPRDFGSGATVAIQITAWLMPPILLSLCIAALVFVGFLVPQYRRFLRSPRRPYAFCLGCVVMWCVLYTLLWWDPLGLLDWFKY